MLVVTEAHLPVMHAVRAYAWARQHAASHASFTGNDDTHPSKPTTTALLASRSCPVYTGQSMPDDVRPPTVYPAGTILSCPALSCGARVYRLRTAASFGEIVTNDGVLLQPVNAAIPARKVWDPLACPLCGTALVHDGQLHTAESGWW
jgi:hypothetical protein